MRTACQPTERPSLSEGATGRAAAVRGKVRSRLWGGLLKIPEQALDLAATGGVGRGQLHVLVERCLGVGAAAEFDVALAESTPGVEQLAVLSPRRRLVDPCLQGLDRGRVLVLVAVDPALLVVGLEQGRVVLLGLAEARDGELTLVEIALREAEGEVRVKVVVGLRDDGLEQLQGLARRTFVGVEPTEQRRRLEVVGVELERALVVPAGLVGAAVVLEALAQPQLGLGITLAGLG